LFHPQNSASAGSERLHGITEENMSPSIPAIGASNEATQRKLISGIVIVTLVSLAITIADFAIGGRPDPPMLRAAATLLDGSWRFHTGDDPRWADVDADDSGWDTIDLTASPGSHDGDVGRPDYVSGWRAHGHPGYDGYAWYRRAVSVPADHTAWDILGPSLVDDGYELYWNGQKLGGSGRLGASPHLVGTRPLLFVLPADATGATGVLAVRVFMHSRSGVSTESGGMHSAPLLAPRPVADALHRVQWQRTIAGYIADLIEPIAMLALIGLVLWRQSSSSRKGFLIFASIALALTAIRRANNAIVSWTDLEDITTYSWLASWMWAPTIGAWALAWNRWPARAWRSIDGAAVVLTVIGTVGGVMHASSVTNGCRFASIMLFVVIGARIVRSAPLRVLALVTFALTMAGLFGGELLDPIGVPGIWFPFGIGVSRTQVIYALAIPLLAILIVRTLGPDESVSGLPP
jgi:hypothetical protein